MRTDDEATGRTAEELARPTSRVDPLTDRGGSVLSWEAYRARGRVPVLDGIRALSILLVVTAHPEYHGVWPQLHGNTGVSIFFALSGYLITTLALREESKHGHVDLVGFYIRRLFRIYPLYFLVLAFYCVLLLVLHQTPDRRDTFVSELPWFILGAPEHGTFFSSSAIPTPFAGAWSIGIEEKFYLVWPFLGFVALVGARRHLRLTAALTIFVAACIANALGGSWGNALAPYGLIAIGVCAAILLHDEHTYDKVSVLGTPPVLGGLALLFLALQLGTVHVMPGHAGYVLFGLVIAPLLAGIVVTTSRWTGFLQSTPMVKIGLWSYGLYLTHAFALNTVEKVLPQTSFLMSFVSVVLAVAITCFGCALLHRWFENPLHRYGQRLAAEHAARARGGAHRRR